MAPQADLAIVRQLAESARTEIGVLGREVADLRHDVADLKLALAKGQAVREWLSRVPMWAALAVSVLGALRSFGVL